MSHRPLERHRALSTNAPLRILVGPYEISGQIPDYAAGFRALGHQVTTVIREPNRLFPELRYDVDLSANRDPSLLATLIRDHDVFVFQYGESLATGGTDLPAIRAAGKAIIAICNGDDIRHSSAYHQEFGVPPETLGETYVTDPVIRPMRALRLMEQYASLMVSVPNQSGLSLRPYMHFAYPLDLSQYEAHSADRERPVVVHAPSNRAAKGTAQILAALDRLSARGVPFDVQLLERVPNAVVRQTLRDADVAVDQLFASYGKFAAEALATGCATACVTFPELEPFAHLRPLWHIDEQHHEQQLERLLTDRALRRSLSERGRAHVEQVHDRTVVCDRLLQSLRAAIDGTLRYDYYPTFFATQYRLPAGVELPRYQRTLASRIVVAHGGAEGTDLIAMARRGLVDATTLSDVPAIPVWPSASGLADVGRNASAIGERWNMWRVAREASPRSAPSLQRDAVMSAFAVETSLSGTRGTAATNDPATVYQQLGLPMLALQELLPHSITSADARRASGLLLLGTGQFADAESMLETVLDDTDPIAMYYYVVARVLQGKQENALETLRAVVQRLPRDPQLLLWGSTPILHKRYWVEAMREGGTDARSLMTEFYAAINRREDFDHYTMDFVPEWTDFRYARLLAPYHAFLFVAMYAKVLHTSFDGGALQESALTDVESALLQAAGVKTVLTTYGSDGAMYSRIRDLSVRHAIQLSYPDAARRETQIEARVARWTRDADCILGNIHSLDGHGRWDVLIGNNAQIDLTRIQPVASYSEADGLNGVVRVMHTPNHRGVKGTEFLMSAVETLQQEGLQVELVLLERVQNHEVLARLRTVDILAEQFVLPFYGLSGIEGLATGIPVMSNLTVDDTLQVLRRFSYLNECPVVGASPETLTDVLRRLVTDPALRATLGRAGRRYAEKYHSYAMTRHLFGAIHRWLDGDRTVDLMNLYHPLRSSYVRERPVAHPLVNSRLP